MAWDLETDVVVIGSGAGGASAAVTLAEGGLSTALVEEGGWVRRKDFTSHVYGALKNLFRDFGAQPARGQGALFPVLQGCCVGGSTVMNGAIVHRLPEKVYRAWAEDPAVEKDLPWTELQAIADRIEKDLDIRPNLASVLDGLPASKALKKLGWKHQAMRRNAPGCQGSGRCLQGCPSGGKLSMENSYIPRAIKAGATLLERHRAANLIMEGRGAQGVEVFDADGRRKRIKAKKAVVVSAGTVQTPLLLKRAGLGGAQAGRHFQCHLAASVVGLLDRPVLEVEGPPQGIEVLEFQNQGVKLATQLLPPELLLSRTSAVGDRLVELLQRWTHLSDWTASISSNAEGTVSSGGWTGANVRFAPGQKDLERLRFALHKLAVLQFELGASVVWPGIAGIAQELKNPRDAEWILNAPLNAGAYFIGVSHIFGTCRMGGDPTLSVTGANGLVHGTDNVFVADGSLFPSSIGVNPQHTIMTLAIHVANKVLNV